MAKQVVNYGAILGEILAVVTTVNKNRREKFDEDTTNKQLEKAEKMLIEIAGIAAPKQAADVSGVRIQGLMKTIDDLQAKISSLELDNANLAATVEELQKATKE